ncbi:TPA: tyrosine-type recombinase/integrase [Escherichia coli]
MEITNHRQTDRQTYNTALLKNKTPLISDNTTRKTTLQFYYYRQLWQIKPMSENIINKVLRNRGYNTNQDICGHGFRTLACSALIESGLWSEDAVELQMSHKESNSVRAAYTHKAKHLEQRRLMLQWWADYLDANSNDMVRPFEFAQKR